MFPTFFCSAKQKSQTEKGIFFVKIMSESHSFTVSIAQEVGVIGAILFQHFHFLNREAAKNNNSEFSDAPVKFSAAHRNFDRSRISPIVRFWLRREIIIRFFPIILRRISTLRQIYIGHSFGKIVRRRRNWFIFLIAHGFYLLLSYEQYFANFYDFITKKKIILAFLSL